jgi:hypothetical protein
VALHLGDGWRQNEECEILTDKGLISPPMIDEAVASRATTSDPPRPVPDTSERPNDPYLPAGFSRGLPLTSPFDH